MEEDDDGRLRARARRLRASLRPNGARIARLLAHPAALLVLGFFLTGGVGTWLAHRWQINQTKRQQQHDWDQHLLQEKYAVIDQLTQAAGEDMAAARDIIDIIFWCWDESQEHARIQRRIDDWDKARRTWRAKSMVLRARVGVFFDDPEALRILNDIIEKIHQLEQPLKSIVQRLEEQSPQESKPGEARADLLAAQAGHSMDRVDEIEAQLAILTQRLQGDLNQAPGAPTSPAPASPLPKLPKLPPPHPCKSPAPAEQTPRSSGTSPPG